MICNICGEDKCSEGNNVCRDCSTSGEEYSQS